MHPSHSESIELYLLTNWITLYNEDQFLGKFKAILIALVIYICGLVLLVATPTPTAIESGAAFGGLIVAIIIIGLGTGVIKLNVTPLCAEQYKFTPAFICTFKSGERVLVDLKLTPQRIFMRYVFIVHLFLEKDNQQPGVAC